MLKNIMFQLKRMKQIEQEKDVLMQGLQAVERAREWYLKQVAAVQEKMKYLGRMGSHMVRAYSCISSYSEPGFFGEVLLVIVNKISGLKCTCTQMMILYFNKKIT